MTAANYNDEPPVPLPKLGRAVGVGLDGVPLLRGFGTRLVVGVGAGVGGVGPADADDGGGTSSGALFSDEGTDVGTARGDVSAAARAVAISGA